MIFISDVQNYAPVKLCKTAGSSHLFKIIGMLKVDNIKLINQEIFIGYIRDRWERSHSDF